MIKMKIHAAYFLNKNGKKRNYVADFRFFKNYVVNVPYQIRSEIQNRRRIKEHNCYCLGS